MGNMFSSDSSNSGGLLGGLGGDAGGIFSIVTHPLDALMMLVGGIILMVILYRIVAD